MAKNDPRNAEATHLSAREARGGDIVLKSRARRAIFIAGLALIVVVAAFSYWIG